MTTHTHTHIRFGAVCRASTSERATGGNAVALSAYHAAERFETADGRVFDFTRKRRELVTETRVLLPDGAPVWAADPAALWRAAEAADKRRDSCTARWVEVSIPRAVPPELHAGFAEAIGRMLADRYGVAVQTDAHSVPASDGGTNAHVHILAATRVFDGNKFGKKCSALDQGFRARRGRDMRAAVAEAANKFLAEHAIADRLDPEKQGGPVPPERDVPRAAVEAWKKNPDDAESFGSVIASRPVRRQLRAARRAAAQSAQEATTLAARHERQALALRPLGRRPCLPWIEVEPGGPVAAVSRRDGAVALRLHDGAIVTQRSDALRFRGPVTDAALAVAAERCLAAGWKTVSLSGADAGQRDRLAAALAARGITVVGEARRPSRAATAVAEAYLATQRQPPAAALPRQASPTPPSPAPAAAPPRQASPRPPPPPARQPVPPRPAPRRASSSAPSASVETSAPAAPAPAYRPPWITSPGVTPPGRRSR